MEEKLENTSFLSLFGSDSGLTLVNTDALVRKTEQQQRQLQCKEKEIQQLRDALEQLEDVVDKYATQFESINEGQEQPQTKWTKNLIKENEEMRGKLDILFGDRQQLQADCSMLKESLEDKEQELKMLRDRFEQLQSEEREVFAEESQVKNSLVENLREENMKVKEEAKLLSMENQELANECLVLAQGMEAKEKEVLILEERIKGLENEKQIDRDSERKARHEEEYVAKDEELPMVSNQVESKHYSDGQFYTVEEKDENGEDLNDDKLSLSEPEDVTMQSQPSDHAAVGMIFPGRMTNVQQYLDHMEELKLLKSFVTEMAVYFNLADGMKLRDVLHEIKRKSLNLIQENKQLNGEAQESKSLVEFLELERKFTLEELEETKAKNADLTSKIEEIVEEQVAAQSQSEVWSNHCGKLLLMMKKKSKTKVVERKQILRRNSTTTESMKRKKLRKKCSSMKVHLQSHVAKTTGLRRCINALAGKNMELELLVDDLKEEIANAVSARDEFELAFKEEMQANMHLHQKLESFQSQAEILKAFDSNLKEKKKQIHAITRKHDIVVDELMMEKQFSEYLAKKLQLTRIGKELIERKSQRITGSYEEYEKRLAMLEAEKANLKAEFENERQKIMGDLSILKDKNDELAKDLEGEIKIRFVYERKLNEYFSEKQAMENRLGEEMKKSFEAENIIGALQEIVEKMKKPKRRSRLSRFFRRGPE